MPDYASRPELLEWMQGCRQGLRDRRRRIWPGLDLEFATLVAETAVSGGGDPSGGQAVMDVARDSKFIFWTQSATVPDARQLDIQPASSAAASLSREG